MSAPRAVVTRKERMAWSTPVVRDHGSIADHAFHRRKRRRRKKYNPGGSL